MAEQPVQKSAHKHLWSILIVIALMALTFWTLFHGMDWRAFIKTLQHAAPVPLLVGLALSVLYVFFEGQSVRAICRSLGYTYGMLRGFVYANTEIYFSAVTPSATGGQPAMAYYMAKGGVPVSVSSIALLLNTVQYTLSLILLGGAALILRPRVILDGGLVVKLLFGFGAAANFILIAACLLFMFSDRLVKRLGLFVIGALCRLRLCHDRKKKTHAFFNALKTYHQSARHLLKTPLLFFKTLGYNILQRVSIFSVAFCVYVSLCAGTYTFVDFFCIQALTAVAVNSLPLPGGIGAAEGVFHKLYRSVYASGSLIPALLLTRGISFYFVLLFSGLITLVHHLRRVP